MSKITNARNRDLDQLEKDFGGINDPETTRRLFYLNKSAEDNPVMLIKPAPPIIPRRLRREKSTQAE